MYQKSTSSDLSCLSRDNHGVATCALHGMISALAPRTTGLPQSGGSDGTFTEEAPHKPRHYKDLARIYYEPVLAIRQAQTPVICHFAQRSTPIG